MIVLMQFVSSLSIFFIEYQMVKEWDKDFATTVSQKKAAVVVACTYLLIIALLNRQLEFGEAILGSFFWGAITVAALCDYCTKEVYDLVYLPAFVAGIARLIQSPEANITELIVFVVLQAVLFSRIYGISDCIAFSICALWMSSSGGNMFVYLIHMSVTMIFLTLVQGCKKNINKKGNLKKEVAMIPYIAASMIMVF